MSSTVEDFTALFSGYNLNGNADVNGNPVFITYSFDEAPDDSGQDSYSPSFLASFSTFTFQEQSVAAAALQQWDDASGVTFLQVAPGEGDIRFGSYDFSQDPNHSGAAGFAYYPGTNISQSYSYDSPIGSDVFIRQEVEDYSLADMQHVLIHEIGHALGLKHPFDGDVVLDTSLDNTSETVMSYNGYDPNLGPLDKQAVSFLYGSGSSDGSQDSSSYWNPDSETLIQYGKNSDDIMRGVSTQDFMRGGPGDDILFGEAGNDLLAGGAGNDVLTGGMGADRFVFNQPLSVDNVDKITDFVAGEDRIALSGAVFSGLQGGLLSSDYFVIGSKAVSADPTIIYNSRTGSLSYDADGAGKGVEAQQFAQLQTGLQLSASDFRVF